MVKVRVGKILWNPNITFDQLFWDCVTLFEEVIWYAVFALSKYNFICLKNLQNISPA